MGGESLKVEEITVVIDKDGKVTIEVSGMTGDSCLDATKGLEALLGGDVTERKRHDEPEPGISTNQRVYGS